MIKLAQYEMGQFWKRIVSKSVTPLWEKQYYPTFHRDTPCKDGPKTEQAMNHHGPTTHNSPTDVYKTPTRYPTNNNNMSTSLTTVALNGNNEVQHGSREKGTLAHLLMKMMTNASAPFAAQDAARDMMRLIKYHDDKAVFLNHKNESVSSTEDIGTTADEFGQYATYKTIKISNGRIQHRIFFTVRLSKPFWQVKNEECIETLKQNRVFLEQKAFRSTDFIELGWLARVHPSINWPEELKEKFRQIIAMIMKKDPPPFDLVKRPKKFGNKERIESLAVVVETAKEDAAVITNALINKQFRDATGALFIPANLIKSFGQTAYRMVLRDHTIFCNSIQTIPVFGLLPQLLHFQDSDGAFPVSDAIVDVEKVIDIHRTAQSFANGKYLVSFPRGKYDYAMERINGAINIIIERDMATSHPHLLFDGRMPSIGHAPVQFEDKELNTYATDLCKTLNVDTTKVVEEPAQPSIITLNRGRQYNSNNGSPSYQSMLTGDNMSQNSALTTPTQQSAIDKLEADVRKLHQKMADFVTAQQQGMTTLETKIEQKIDAVHMNNETKFTASFNQWADGLLEKLSTTCQEACARAVREQHNPVDNEARKRIKPTENDTLNTPSPDSAMETEPTMANNSITPSPNSDMDTEHTVVGAAE